jgi:hypothetical protein
MVSNETVTRAKRSRQDRIRAIRQRAPSRFHRLKRRSAQERSSREKIPHAQEANDGAEEAQIKTTVRLNLSLNIEFIPLSPRESSVYHLARGSTNMDEWEELQKKLKADLNSARVSQDLALRKQQAIDEHQTGLWNSLQEMGKKAVDRLNGSDNFLIFAPNDIGKPSGFRIIFQRADKQRTAEFSFNTGSHLVTVVVQGKTRADRNFKIIGDDNGEVHFQSTSTTSATISPAAIIQEAISLLV